MSKEAQMSYVHVTRMLVVFIVAVVAAWDVYVIFQGQQEATFSVVLYESSKRWPVIPFVLGFLCGHVFWQIYGD
jgi:H+/Cl- antiporter ClcA